MNLYDPLTKYHISESTQESSLDCAKSETIWAEHNHLPEIPLTTMSEEQPAVQFDQRDRSACKSTSKKLKKQKKKSKKQLKHERKKKKQAQYEAMHFKPQSQSLLDDIAPSLSTTRPTDPHGLPVNIFGFEYLENKYHD